MAKFNRGEICIGQNFECDTERNGMECEVLDVLPEGGVFSNTRIDDKVVIDSNAYQVRWCDGMVSWNAEYNLRRKPPQRKDRDTKTEWDETIWAPHEVTA